MSPKTSSDRVDVGAGGGAFVEMMNSNSVEYLFINSSTDTFPIQEGIAKLRESGRPRPDVIPLSRSRYSHRGSSRLLQCDGAAPGNPGPCRRGHHADGRQDV